jgi:thioesterase domain-containing protein
MAAGYLAEVRSVQPRGPYLIGGYCFGALVATEMAQQLRANGEEVGVLALFVGYAPDRGKRRASLSRLGARLRFHLDQARSRRRGELAYVLESGGRAARALGAEVMSWLRPDVRRTNLRAARRYVPRTYPGRMTVFLSGEPPRDYVLDPARDLGGLTAHTLEVVPVPGSADTMMKEPHVGALSERLKALLDRAPAKELPTAS